MSTQWRARLLAMRVTAIRKSPISRLALVPLFVVVSGLCLIPGAARATDGDLFITTNTRLTEDHIGRITMDADNVTLDCAGHTVRGPGPAEPSGAGIYMNNRSGVTIKRCVVSGFFEGIVLDYSSNNTVALNIMRENEGVGMRLTFSERNTVTGNLMVRNQSQTGLGANGLHLFGSSSNVVTFNTVRENESTGMSVVEGSDANHITGNVSSGNGDHGFDVINAARNVVSRNIALRNAGYGFRVTQPLSTGNVIRQNVACHNGIVDAIEEDSGGQNIWVLNQFCTPSP